MEELRVQQVWDARCESGPPARGAPKSPVMPASEDAMQEDFEGAQVRKRTRRMLEEDDFPLTQVFGMSPTMEFPAMFQVPTLNFLTF